MIRIGYIINNLVVGGAELLLLDIIKHLDKTHYVCYVYTLFKNNPLKQEFIKAGAIVKEIKMCNNREFWKIFFLSNLLKKDKIDIVHTHLCDADIFGRYAARIAGIKVIISTEHSIDPWKYGKDIKRKIRIMLDRYSISFTNLIICVSKAVQNYHIKWGIPSDKTYLLYPSVKYIPQVTSKIEKRKELGIEIDNFVVLNVSRLFEVKNHYTLLQVAFDILQYNNDITFIIVGDGPLKQKLRDLVENSKFRNKIMFLGTRTDVYEIMQMSDIFVLPSLYEGLPISIIEAMSCGLPIVASNVGGIPEIIDNSTGILIDPSQKDELKNAILKMHDDKNLRISMGKAGYEKVIKSFSFDNYMCQLTKLYNTLFYNKRLKKHFL